jgi:hypothetical protein
MQYTQLYTRSYEYGKHGYTDQRRSYCILKSDDSFPRFTYQHIQTRKT